jgi:predicted Zn-ribbon and HTH transcriptional regulator
MTAKTKRKNTMIINNCSECPSCGEIAGFWPADYVDNGVGMEKCNPAHCEKCGWSEPSFDELFNMPNAQGHQSPTKKD